MIKRPCICVSGCKSLYTKGVAGSVCWPHPLIDSFSFFSSLLRTVIRKSSPHPLPTCKDYPSRHQRPFIVHTSTQLTNNKINNRWPSQLSEEFLSSSSLHRLLSTPLLPRAVWKGDVRRPTLRSLTMTRATVARWQCQGCRVAKVVRAMWWQPWSTAVSWGLWCLSVWRWFCCLLIVLNAVSAGKVTSKGESDEGKQRRRWSGHVDSRQSPCCPMMMMMLLGGSLYTVITGLVRTISEYCIMGSLLKHSLWKNKRREIPSLTLFASFMTVYFSFFLLSVHTHTLFSHGVLPVCQKQLLASCEDIRCPSNIHCTKSIPELRTHVFQASSNIQRHVTENELQISKQVTKVTNVWKLRWYMASFLHWPLRSQLTLTMITFPVWASPPSNMSLWNLSPESLQCMCRHAQRSLTIYWSPLVK